MMSGYGIRLFDLWHEVSKTLSSRNLTYEADTLYAAAGLLNILEKAYGEASIHGLPESCIEYYLYWIPFGYRSLRRRTDKAGKPWGPS